MFKCSVCKKEFKDGEKAVPIFKYMVNYRRGDSFQGIQADEWVHLKHIQLKEEK